MVPGVSYDVKLKIVIVAKVENRDLRTTNNSLVISYWPLNKCDLDRWEKTKYNKNKTKQLYQKRKKNNQPTNKTPKGQAIE